MTTSGKMSTKTSAEKHCELKTALNFITTQSGSTYSLVQLGKREKSDNNCHVLMLTDVKVFQMLKDSHHTTTTLLRPFFRDYRGELVPEEKLLDFTVQGKINRGRHTDHLAGCHSIRTNQHPPPPSHFLQAGYLSCHPANSVKAMKAVKGQPMKSKLQLNT